MTDEFEEKMESSQFHNRGNNHSCLVTGDGFFINSCDDFVTQYQHEGYIDALGFLWRKGDKVHVEIDMINQKGRIWNDTDNDRNVFEIGLPERVAILVDVIKSETWEIQATHQEFRYEK